ncbi:uncharacterized protein LOC131927103 [Physella acuta]|uniref:uncharacterized protein LOC131927103 n=1 Tax=Physella acuta TaxID=109671 RepID=UPI0027DE6319|nr:uncharacterized protein LOC131927103 [Physella acuta]
MSNEKQLAVTDELKLLSENSESPIVSLKFQKFLNESINFLNTQGGSNCTTNKELLEWYEVLEQVLHTLILRQNDLDPKRLSLQKIITYLGHCTFHLLKVEEVPLGWYKSLAIVVLEYLADFIQSSGSQPSFVASVATNFFGCFCKAGQKFEKEIKSKTGLSVVPAYELYLLASAIQSLDSTNKTRDGLKVAKEFLISYTQLVKGSDQVLDAGAALSDLFEAAVKVYTLQSRDVADDSSLSFFVELFRLVQRDAGMCERLLACDGNLYKLETADCSHDFPVEASCRLIKKNKLAVSSQVENRIQEIVISLLKFTCSLNDAAPWDPTQSGHSKNNKKPSKKDNLEMDDSSQMESQLSPTISHIQALLSESQKPVSLAIGDSLSALVSTSIDPRQTATCTLMLLYRLLSLAIEIFLREILARAGKESYLNFVSARVYSLALANKTRLNTLQALLSRDESDKLVELSTLQKGTLNSLCRLSQAVSKKNILSALPNAASQVLKCLESATVALGSIGRQLRRQEKHAQVVRVLAPVWPVPKLAELLAHVRYHESLAESYRSLGQKEKACCVIVEAARLDTKLITEPLIKTIWEMAKQDPSLPVVKMFEPLLHEEEQQHAQLMEMVCRWILSFNQSPSLSRAIADILECLSAHPALSSCEKAVYSLLLVENKAFSNDDNHKISSQMLQTTRASISVLGDDSSHSFDDFLSQMTFLYWEMCHRLTCLDKANAEHEFPEVPTTPPPIMQSTQTVKPPTKPCLLEPQTPMDQAPTPKLKLSFQTPVRPRKQVLKSKGKNLASQPLCQVDSDTLMTKASVCLTVWTEWFNCHKSLLMTMEDGRFRAERSLTFLQRVAELALANHQTTTALQAFCLAKNLATLAEKTDVVKRVTGQLIALVAQVGLKCDDGSSDKDLFEDSPDDVFMSSLGLGEDGHILDLVSIAAHHLRTGELMHFVKVRNLVNETCDKAVMYPSTVIALSFIKRLSAEFAALFPEISDYGSESHDTYPLLLAGDALKYSSSIAMFYLGKDYKSIENKGPSIDTWQIVHNYLTTLKLNGELFMHIGNIKYARTYFTEGLKMSESYLLVTWSAIFLCKLVEVALCYYDTTKEAQGYLKRALRIVGKQSLSSQEVEAASCTHNPLDQFHCHFHTDRKQNQCICSNRPSQVDELDVRELLFEAVDNEEVLEDEGPDVKFLCHAVSCSHCYNPNVAHLCTQLMWYQAEIASKNGQHSAVIESLNAAGCTSQAFSEKTYQRKVLDVLAEYRFNFSVGEHGALETINPLLETKFRLASYLYHCLYNMPEHEGCEVRVEDLKCCLDSVVNNSTEVCSLNNSVVLASTHLLKSHMKHLPELLTHSQMVGEEAREWTEQRGTDLTDEEIIALGVSELQAFNTFWNSQKVLDFKSVNLVTASDSVQPDTHLRTPTAPFRITTSVSPTSAISTKVSATSTKVSTSSSIKSGAKTSKKLSLRKDKVIQIFDDSVVTPCVKKPVKTLREHNPPMEEPAGVEAPSRSSRPESTKPVKRITRQRQVKKEMPPKENVAPKRSSRKKKVESPETGRQEPLLAPFVVENLDVSYIIMASPVRGDDSCLMTTSTWLDSPEVPRGRGKKKQETEKTTGTKRLEKTELMPDISDLQIPVSGSAESDQLRDALQRMKHFPHSFLYSQISRALALNEWSQETLDAKSRGNGDQGDHKKIAAYLTDSMHLTFRHLMTRNLQSKLRKCKDSMSRKLQPDDSDANMYLSDWCQLTGEDLTHEVTAMSEALSRLQPGGEVELLDKRLAALPADWTVVQLTVVNYNPLNPGTGQVFITRLTPDLEPVTVELPHKRWLYLTRASRVYETAIKYDNNLSPVDYWNHRFRKDKDIKNVVQYLQEMFLSSHKWLLRGRVDLVGQPKVSQLLETAAQNAVDTVLHQLKYQLNYNTVRVLLEAVLCAHEQDVTSLFACVWPQDVSSLVSQICLQLQGEVAQAYGEECLVTRGPVVLILDKTLNKLPWESMPDFLTEMVTRVPSLVTLDALLALHQNKLVSSYRRGVDRDSAVAVIDPETNLLNAVNVLLPQFQQYDGWNCLSQKAPTVLDLKDFLSNNALYLYCGHGWGSQFVGGDDLQMLNAKAVAVLMGCDSGKLDYKPRLDGDGGPLYFLLAGCPTVVGNLWVVTDKDINLLTSSLMTEWMSQKKPVPLSHVLTAARKVCRLTGLNGFAPVVYGLPVLLNC